MAAGEKSFVKGLSFSDFGVDGNPAVVDVKKGKIVRIRPLHYDWQYDPKQFNPWKIDKKPSLFFMSEGFFI